MTEANNVEEQICLEPKYAKFLLSQDFLRLMLRPSKEDRVHAFYIIA